MEPRISVVTLRVADLERSYRFYKDGLRLPATRKPADGIIFFETSGAILAISPFAALAEDAGPGWHAWNSRGTGIMLTHNVRERHEVDDVLSLAAAAGANVVKAACEASWGGYAGYFTDPDGYLWEVTWGRLGVNEGGPMRVT
jgi:catechol 2,3-dioxygenase-like lactoylglutathione lyase family enzyme